MNNYSWDITKFVTYLLPSFLRKAKQIAWIKACLAPMNTLNADLVQFVTDTRYRLNFTGQVISLQRLLNDKFDNTLRRIYIGDGNNIEKFVARTGSNNPPAPEQKVFATGASSYAGEDFAIFATSETGSSELYDFTINIPSALTYNANTLNALVNIYKRAGRKYKILTF